MLSSPSGSLVSPPSPARKATILIIQALFLVTIFSSAGIVPTASAALPSTPSAGLPAPAGGDTTHNQGAQGGSRSDSGSTQATTSIDTPASTNPTQAHDGQLQETVKNAICPVQGTMQANGVNLQLVNCSQSGSDAILTYAVPDATIQAAAPTPKVDVTVTHPSAHPANGGEGRPDIRLRYSSPKTSPPDPGVIAAATGTDPKSIAVTLSPIPASVTVVEIRRATSEAAARQTGDIAIILHPADQEWKDLKWIDRNLVPGTYFYIAYYKVNTQDNVPRQRGHDAGIV